MTECATDRRYGVASYGGGRWCIVDLRTDPDWPKQVQWHALTGWSTTFCTREEAEEVAARMERHDAIWGKLIERVGEQCDRAGLSPDDRAAVVDWAQNALMDYGILENVMEGRMEIAGVEDGQPTLRITAAGEQYVQDVLLPEARSGG